MGAQILQFRAPTTVDEAWARYTELVDERHAKNLWKDLEHNKRLAVAWEAWSRLYLGEERQP